MGATEPQECGCPHNGGIRVFFNPKPSLAKGGLGVSLGQAKGGKGHVLAGHGRAGRQAGVVAVPACVGVVCGCCGHEVVGGMALVALLWHAF